MDSATFVDGTTEEIDVVIYVVGFKSLHSCLDDSDAGIFTGKKLWVHDFSLKNSFFGTYSLIWQNISHYSFTNELIYHTIHICLAGSQILPV